MSDEKITLVAVFRDLVSRPARKAARAVDEFGDEASDAAGDLNKLDAAMAGTGVQMQGFAAKTEASTGAIRRHRADTDGASNSVKRLGRETDITGNKSKRAVASISKIGTTMNFLQRFTMAAVGSLFKFSLVLLKIGALFAVVELVQLLVVAVQGLSAAALAAVASLGPLLGIVGAVAGIIPTALVGMGLLKLAMGGIAEAFQVLNDPNATSEQIDKAMNNISANARQTLTTLVLLKKEWAGLKNIVQDRFFAGVGPQLKQLSPVMRPIVERNMSSAAGGVNKVIVGFMQWMSSPQGARAIDKMMQLGSFVLVSVAVGLAKVSQIGIKLAELATPLIQAMAKDILGALFALDEWIDRHPKEVMTWFTESWGHIKGWLSVLRDFGMGIYHVLAAATPMVSFLGDSMGETARKFREWAANPETQKKLEDWYRRMIPVVSAIASIIGAIAKMFWNFGNGKEGKFVEIFTKIEENVLPLIGKLLDQLANENILDSFLNIITAILKVLSDPVVVDVIGDLVRMISNLVVGLLDAFNSLSDDKKRFIISMIAGAALILPLAAALVGGGAIALAIVLVLAFVALVILLWDWWKKLWNLWKEIWAWVSPVFEAVGMWMWKVILWLLRIGGLVPAILENIAKFYQSAVDFVVGLFRFGLDQMKVIYETFVKMFATIPLIFKGIFDAIGAALAPAARVINTLWERAQSIMQGVQNLTPGGIATTVGRGIADVAGGKPFAGWFADGGLVPGGSLAIVGERGPELAIAGNGMSIVGSRGAEWFSADRDTTILPNDVLNALRQKGDGQHSYRDDAIRASDPRNGEKEIGEQHDHLHLDGVVVRSEDDIDSIFDKWEKYQKNKKERK